MLKEKNNSYSLFFGIVVALISLSSVLFFTLPHLTAQFGISSYAAKKIIDIVSGAGSVWAIIAVVGGSYGFGAALLASARYFLKRYSKVWVTAW